MSKDKINFGKQGQDLVVEYLKNNGYKILSENYRCYYGEIDLIAAENKTICFIEVKSRKNSDLEFLEHALNRKKQNHIINSALNYLKEQNYKNYNARFDVAVVLLNDNNLEIKLIKNAFELTERYD